MIYLKIKIKGLVNKSDISGFINNSNLDKKIKLQTYDSSLFIGQSYFINDGSHKT